MKKILLASVFGGMMMFSAGANAVDSTGCGLGSMAWRGQSGRVPQILAATTNGLFGTQTFGITFGTSGCDPNGRITGGTQKMVLAFLENNMEQYAMDAARGQGETIDTLAGILIPLTLNKFKVDPAVSSGVFLIALTDSGGYFIFLGLASLILL